jgi:predicted enzyme related to lactoylglutathione lyase
MPRVVHFEIPADDPERAAKFYGKVFDWKITTWGGPEDYWLATTGPDTETGINGAIAKRGESLRSTTNTIAVSSVDDFSQKIVAAGGKVLSPKTLIPGVGQFAYCQDTEGNAFGILQPDMPAK